MRERKFLAVGIGAALLAAGAIWLSHPKKSPEEQVKDVLLRAKAGLEEKSLQKCMSVVSKNYRDSSGMNYYQVLRGASKVCNQDRYRLQVWLGTPEIYVQESEAVAIVPIQLFQVFGGQTAVEERLESISALQPFNLELRLRREGAFFWSKQWKITRAEGWQETDIGALE